MEWLLLIVIVIFLGIWLWNIRQRRIAKQQQQFQEAKITEATRLVTPLVEKAYILCISHPRGGS
jgi:preprotein translocase subunit YajC